jgi:hypothetical protein
MKLKLMFYDKRIYNTRKAINPLNTLKRFEKRENSIIIYYELLQQSRKNYIKTRGEKKLL